MILELLLTRVREKQLIEAARGLRFLVLDELHTYRGCQGADLAMFVRRARDTFEVTELQCVGTSATIADLGSLEQQRSHVAAIECYDAMQKAMGRESLPETPPATLPEGQQVQEQRGEDPR